MSRYNVYHSRDGGGDTFFGVADSLDEEDGEANVTWLEAGDGCYCAVLLRDPETGEEGPVRG